jgi:fatty-acid desaturase
MNDILMRLVNVFPAIVIIGLLIYYSSKKKIPGLLWMLIAYIVIMVISIGTMYLPRYVSDRALSVAEMEELYKTIGIVSLVANALLAVGIGILLNSYPSNKNEELTPSKF